MPDNETAGDPLSAAGQYLTDQYLTDVTARSMRWAVDRHDIDEVGQLVEAAVDAHGWDAVHALLIGWTMLMQQEVLPHTMDHPELIGTFVPHSEATGQTCDVDGLPPPIAWAGRWIQAVITRDEDNAGALWDILSEDQDIGPYLDAVLTATAGLIRRRENGEPIGPSD